MSDDFAHLEIQNIMIVEDHELFGDGIELLLRTLFSEANIRRSLDFDAAWQCLHTMSNIDLLLMDLKMPGTTGLNGVRAVRQAFPSLTLVVLSSMDSSVNVEKVMALGVNGFISKSSSKQKMSQAIALVLQGNVVTEAPYTALIKLSQRQQQTLHLMAQGKTNKEIAKELDISPNTVKEYVSIVISLLDAENRTQAVQKAENMGLLFDNK